MLVAFTMVKVLGKVFDQLFPDPSEESLLLMVPFQNVFLK
jgi:hypothetical protein